MFQRIKIESMFSRAQKLAASEKFDEAIERFDKIISIKPDYAAVYLHKALVLSEKNEYPKAVAAMKKAVELKPENAVYTMFLGMIHYDNQKFDEAQKALKKSSELNPKNAFTLCLGGLIHLAEGKIKEAYPVLKQNIANTSADCQSRLLVLCESYMHINRVDGKSSDTSLKKYYSGENLSLLLLMGIMYYELKDYAKAEENLTIALEIDSRNSLNYYYLGLCAIAIKDSKKARYWFKKSMTERNPLIASKRLEDMYNILV